MNLYLLSQDINTGYDTFDSCIVAAESAEAAQGIHPYEGRGDLWTHEKAWAIASDTWADKPEQVKVTLIGTAVEGTKAGVILASFNAG